MPDVRRATTADAGALGRLLWDFNTEFATVTDDADVLSARSARLLAREDIVAVLGEEDGEPAGFARVSLPIGVDEVDVDTRRFYERPGFVTIEEGVDHRMLYSVGPTG